MAFSVVMPALEMAQETGKLIAWRKKPGERVAKGEPLLEVETDKAVVELEAPADGILGGVMVQEGAVVPVGQTIAWILGPGEAIPQPVASPAAASSPLLSPAPVPAAAHAATSTVADGRRISPKARRLAKEHGVDFTALPGTGPGGEILASDILTSSNRSSSRASAPAAMETPGAIGRLMAERTTESWTSVPHFFVVREVDAGGLMAARDQLDPGIEPAQGRLTPTDLLVALVARVLVKHPRLNASWSTAGIRLHEAVNIAVATAVDDGVVATVVSNADRTDIGGIAKQRRELTERARAGRLHPSDISAATFTISNLGMYQVDAFSAIIVAPQAAILAVGRIADRVVAFDGRPVIRPMMTLTLSADHRVVDGARAAAFLNQLSEAIQHPEKWLG
jgi:pyruvate dehydrogenase E2 component (dihydrolipoamide acetyltransferase)